MSSSVQFLQFIFEREGMKPESLSSEWDKQKGRKEEFEKLLDLFQLRAIPNRNKFFWDLQLVIEDVLINEEYPDHDTLISLVAEKWNAKFPEVKSTPEIAHNFIHNFHFKFPNNQKAFRAICDGDFEAYTMFDKDPMMFMNMLNRLLIIEIGHYKTFNKISSKVAKKLFKIEDDEKTLNKSLIDLRFMIGNGRIIFPKFNKYGSLYTLPDLVFSQGMKSILKEKLAIDIDFEKQISEERAAARQTERAKNSVGEQKPAVESSESAIKEKGPAKQKEELVNTETTVIHPETADTSLQHVEKFSEVPKQDDSFSVLLEKEFTILKEKILAKYKEEKDVVVQVSNHIETAVPALEFSPKYVSALEEENARLKSELFAAEQKSAQVYKKTITEFIQSIAGRHANYILSDLYQETNNPSVDNYMNTVGLLINLFSEWSMLGLEPHSFGKETGKLFTVSKEELMKNFMVTAPISSLSSDIPVKLVKHGWTFNGKVLVQPLVEEIKGERQ